MKKKQLLFNTAISIFALVLLASFGFYLKKEQKPPKSQSEWFNGIRANQITGKISSADILKAKAEIEKNKKSSNEEFNFNWIDRGPDNAGGRTRALLIDNQNSNLLYAGCVSGGLWTYTESESTNPEDHTWTKVEIESSEILSISCITQTDDGTIYFGTGESFTASEGIGEGGFSGCGIWKGTSNDGFQRLESTWEDGSKETFMFVNEITADPKDNNKIYASTNKGLMFTSDGGTTWANVLPEDNEDAFEISHDVAVSFDGSSSFVIASINYKVYLKKDGGSFELISIKDAVNGENIDTISHKSIRRIEFAVTNLDANYIYSSLSSKGGDFERIYKSTDKGENWKVIGLGGTSQLKPFLGQKGNYSHCLAVRPDNKDNIMIGGSSIFIREETGDWTLFAFFANQQHSIVFPDNYNADDPYHMYFATDGGIVRGTSSGLFNPLGYNYNSTMSYSVAYNKTGNELLTGTEDNGTRLIRETQTPNYSFQLSFGSSGDCEFSMLADDFYFRTNVKGEVYRYNANGPINDLVSSDEVDTQGDPEWLSTYVTPIALWESPNDVRSMDYIIYKIKDTSKNIGEILYYAGDSVFSKSQIGGHNLMYKFEEDFIKTADEDSIFIQDVCQSMFAVGLKNEVMLTFDPLGSNPIYKWFDILPKNTTTGIKPYTVDALEFSKDGDILYVATDRGDLWRLSNLLDSRNDSLMDSDSSAFSVERQIIASFEDRAITSIAVSPTDANYLIITLGNYGNEEYIYYSENAATTETEEGNFVSKQGDLVEMPVYSSLINWKDENQVIIGTEYGVYATENINSENPVWVNANGNLDVVPVLMIKQQTVKNSWQAPDFSNTGVKNHGHIYIATFGAGVHSSDLFEGTSVPDAISEVQKDNFKLNLYPNPAKDFLNISFILDKKRDIKLNIYSLEGKLLKNISYRENLKGEFNKKLSIKDLKNGTYILETISENKKLYNNKFIINK